MTQSKPTPAALKGRLLALAERCEAATRNDPEIDTLVYAAINGWPVEWRGNALVRTTDYYPIGTIDPGERNRWFTGHVGAPAYTASLDAAMSLVPEGRHTELAMQDRHSGRWKWTLRGGFGVRSEARSETPALALTAAALRARAASEEAGRG